MYICAEIFFAMIKVNIKDIISSRILVLDGAFGTMVQGLEPSGCNDLLCLNNKVIVGDIHRRYLESGADIISTNTFNANAISLAEFGLENLVYDINYNGAKVAVEQATAFTLLNPSKPRFVAGSVGPTDKTASLAICVSNPEVRDVTFSNLLEAYKVQMAGLIDGGVDLILIETIFDTLNAKAAIMAAEQVSIERGVVVPIMISVTVTDKSMRTLTGQTLEAFYVSVKHCKNLLSIGLNCSFGAKDMLPALRELNSFSEFPVSAYPNAGLPNQLGEYDESAQSMRDNILPFFKEGLVSIIGGCCGTTPAHIALIAQAATLFPAPKCKVRSEFSSYSGLEPLVLSPSVGFVNVGERANVAGSAIFDKMVREDRLADALGVIVKQIEDGAQVIDICLDDAMIDAKVVMRRFLNLVNSDPSACRLPIMVDSSSWDVIVEALMCLQGKAIVNSISLKEGEDEFLRRAGVIASFGAAAVVMLFDEKGQAASYERKMEIAKRAYYLLVGAGFDPRDIIFDLNILSVATGIEEDRRYALDFINACRDIKALFPFVKVSGGVSNLSFALRGNNLVREAMHSVFLYYAVGAGMDMAIVNAGMLQPYDQINPELRVLVEDVILCRRDDATDRLIDFAQRIKQVKECGVQRVLDWRSFSLEERISYSLVKGVSDFIGSDINEALGVYNDAMSIISGPLMAGMNSVGEMFGQGKMFLPQVVKSARVMRGAVEVLLPLLSGGVSGVGKGAVVLATVKGDVHDIGKSIVAVVLSCNGYNVVDLGVMVPPDRVISSAKECGACAIIVSGLITPSLVEMANLAILMQKEGMQIPLMVGGATTSAVHTAVKLAPLYSGGVFHSKDATDCARVLSLVCDVNLGGYNRGVLLEQQRVLRSNYELEQSKKEFLTISQARLNKARIVFDDIVRPKVLGSFVLEDFDLRRVAKFINWRMFFNAWRVNPQDADDLFKDASALLEEIISKRLFSLRAVVGIYNACSVDESVVLSLDGEKVGDLDFGRSMVASAGCADGSSSQNWSLADFVAPCGSGVDDYVALFAATAGIGAGELRDSFDAKGDSYNAIMVSLLADRLVEALAEVVHFDIRTKYWGFSNEDEDVERILKGHYRSIRPAFGYPSCPNHSGKGVVFDILDVSNKIGISLTSSYAMAPQASVCATVFASSSAKYFLMNS